MSDGTTEIFLAVQEAILEGSDGYFAVSMKFTLGADSVAAQEINEPCEVGNRPLHIAAESGSLDLVTLLLENGADKSTTNIFGQTPVDLAVTKELWEVVEKLDPARLPEGHREVVEGKALMGKASEEEDVSAKVATLRKAFACFDTDGSGELSHDEMRAILTRGAESEVSVEEVQEILAHFDSDGSGKVSIEEFIKGSLDFDNDDGS